MMEQARMVTFPACIRFWHRHQCHRRRHVSRVGDGMGIEVLNRRDERDRTDRPIGGCDRSRVKRRGQALQNLVAQQRHD